MWSNLKQIIFNYFILLTVFLTSIILSCLIPSKSLKHNIGLSLITLNKEGIYPLSGFAWRPIILDNYTDSLMINTAYSVDSGRPIWSSLTNYRYMDTPDQINQITNLEKLYKNNGRPQTGYERYWHGYLTYLRLLLVFFSYSGIRYMITFCLYLLLAWFTYLSFIRLGGIKTAAFLLGFLAVDFFSLGNSLQFSGVFLVGLASSIYYLNTYNKKRLTYPLFFVVGGLTSFFDLLTAPLVTLGILLIIVISLKKTVSIFFSFLSWILGYLSLWFSKWLIVQLLYTPGAITTSFSQIVNRTINKADANFSQINAIKLNILQLIGYHRINQLIFLVLGILFLIFLLKYVSFDFNKIKKTSPFILIGTIPYVWYAVVANHSYLHVWYTYRDQLMSVVCFFIILSEFIQWKKVQQDFLYLKKKILLVF